MAPRREWTLTWLALYQGLVWKNIMLEEEKTFTIPLKAKKTPTQHQTDSFYNKQRMKDVFSANGHFFLQISNLVKGTWFVFNYL